MENTNELLFAVFNGDRELTEEAYQEVLNFAAFIEARKSAAKGKDSK